MSSAAELKTTEKLVEHILRTKPYTRNSDDALIVEVYRLLQPNILTLPFGIVMKCINQLGLPPIKSIERSRRKMQGKYPELCATEKTKRCRKKNEEVYKEVFGNGDAI